MAARAAAIFDPSKPYSPLSIPSTQTALLLMDYQNLTVAFLGEDDGSRAVVKTAVEMRNWALEERAVGSVFHCLVDTRPGVKPEPWMKMAGRWSSYEERLKVTPGLGDEVVELAPSSGSNPSDQLQQRQQDHREDPPKEIVTRRQPGLVSALRSEGLMETLHAKKIRSLIVCGLSSSGCVLSTVRDATDQGFLVTVVEDACADPVPGMHDLLMKHALAATAHVATSGEIWAAWEKERASGK